MTNDRNYAEIMQQPEHFIHDCHPHIYSLISCELIDQLFVNGPPNQLMALNLPKGCRQI